MKSFKHKLQILTSAFPLESGDQDMFCFGLFQRQAIIAKNIIYSLLTHSPLEQTIDISQKLSWRLTTVFITPSWNDFR